MKLFNVEIPKKIILASLLISFLAQAPNIYAWLRTPEGFWFAGDTSWTNGLDVSTYFATIRQGLEGSWLWRNLYTSHSSGAYPLFTLYLLLGHLARLLSLSLPLIFNLSSFFLSLIFFLILYYFISVFHKNERYRVFCFLLVALGGGLGFLSPLHFPDATHAETTVFQSLTLPHWVLDGIFFLLTLLFGFLGVSQRSFKFGALTSLAGLGLATVHPYMLLVAGVILGGYTTLSGFLKKDFFCRVRYLLPLLVVSVAVLSFSYNLLFRDSLLKEWMKQQVIPSPPLWVLLFSYGLLSLFAVFGLFSCGKRKDERSLFLLSWLLLQLGLCYLPVKFQLVMLKNFFVVLCLVAVLGIREFSFSHFSKKTVALVFVSFFLAQPTVLGLRFALATPQNSPFLLPLAEKAAFSWLEKNSLEDSLILSSYSTGNRLPAWTGRRVFIGYGHWTPNFSEKYNKTYSYFKNQMDSLEEEEFLKGSGIDYVFYGPAEQSVGNLYFEEKPELYGKVYENEKVKIFKVL